MTFKFLKKIKLPGLNQLTLYDLLRLYVIGIIKGALSSRASAIAYSFFMSLFPFILFIIILLPHIPIDTFKENFLLILESFLPESVSDFFVKNIFEDIGNSQGARKGILSTVFLLSIVLLANGVNAMFSGFKNSYHQQHLTRNFFKQYLFALGVAIILVLLLLLTVAGLIYFEIYIIENLEDFGYLAEDQAVYGVEIARYVFLIAMIYLATAILYYFGSSKVKRSRFYSVGALFSTFLIILTSYLFGIYIANFSSYNQLYGSLGTLLILMFYLWLNANVLLLGFELNAAISNLKSKKQK